MLQNNYQTPVNQREEFDVLPEDVYQVVIEVANLEERQAYQSKDIEEVLNFKFMIIEDGEYKGRKVWKKIRPTVNAGWEGGSPSDLYELWRAATGVFPTEQQKKDGLTGNDINSLIGRQIRVTLKIKTTAKGKEYNKIEGFMSVKSELAAPKLKPKEAGEVKKLTATKENEPKEEVDDEIPVYDEEDDYDNVNAELAGRKQSIDPADIPF